MRQSPKSGSASSEFSRQAAGLFFAARFILLLSLPVDALAGYGDYWNFFAQAGMGIPFVDYWTEFPPLFPFISRGVYLAVGGQEHVYITSLFLVFTLAQAGTLYALSEICHVFFREGEARMRTAVYGALGVGLFYGWAYFDALAVLTMVLGIFWLGRERGWLGAGSVGLGALIKWFPLLILPGFVIHKKPRRTGQLILIILVIVFSVWGVIYAVSPQYTSASLASQYNKGSWESIWALLDGNLGTGNFSEGIDRRNPETAYLRGRNEPVIDPRITLLVMGLMGLYLLIKLEEVDLRGRVGAGGLTLVIFFLWSPGYSPQWILFLLPVILMVFPYRTAILAAGTAVMISLLEWPVLLSRGLFRYLPGIILIRTLIMVIFGVVFYQVMEGKRSLPEKDEAR